ncbi:MAG: hypothetical protein GY941_13115 [Planctomycetes bacterium]|nr:hypothetical protein [Planctomycetota bacterium]
MEVQCPSCKKQNLDSPVCVRCDCDLKILIEILKAAEAEISISNKKLLQGKPHEALEHAIVSWNLKKTYDTAKLAFLANVSTGKFKDAIKWHYIATRMESGTLGRELPSV